MRILNRWLHQGKRHRILFSPVVEFRWMVELGNRQPHQWTLYNQANVSKCYRFPYGFGTPIWNMLEMMVMVADDFDAKNYCLVAIWVDGDSGILSKMPPTPAFGEKLLHEYWHWHKTNAHWIFQKSFCRSMSNQTLWFTLRTNSSACSAALWANAPKSISSESTPALSTSVI